MGFYEETFADGRRVECETFTCCHCSRIVRFTRKDPVDMCMRCFKRVCPRCHGHGRCIPFEAKVARLESRASILRAAGIE